MSQATLQEWRLVVGYEGLFVGPCPPGMESCHFPDRDPANNRVENLRWDTRAANQADARHHGTLPVGDRSGAAKLTEEAVLEIRRVYKRRHRINSAKALAERFGVKASTILKAVHRQFWRHI